MIGRVLRVMAVGIAVAAAIDPPLTMAARGRARIAMIARESSTDGSRAAERMADLLRAQFEIESGPDRTADAAVIVGTEYLDIPMPERQRIYTVTVSPVDGDRDVRVNAFRAPRDVPFGTLIHLIVDVEGPNVAGTTSTLTVRTGDGAVAIGGASHTWAAPRERWQAALDVTPLGEPPWHLHAEVSPAAGERAQADNGADVMIAASAPLPVLVYEPRPSWAVAFVRRALERDPRFDVASVSLPSRGVAVTAGDSGVQDRRGAAPRLRQAGLARVQAVIVGGLDQVTADDLAQLKEFARVREGAVVLLPDSRADLEAIGRSFPIPAAREVLLEKPERLNVDRPLPAIETSEMLTLAGAPGMRPLAARGAPGDAVIAIAPIGGGRLVLSGALDAWRYRANDDAAFDRFWQSAIAGVAAASPPPVDVSIDPPVAAPGAGVDLHVRVRGDADTIAARVDGGDPIRLWPDAESGTFRGSFVAPAQPGAGRVVVSAGAAAGSARFVVAPRARQARPRRPPLALLAASHGGIDVRPDALSALARRMQQDIAAPQIRVTKRPMRSAWWIVPFVACLGGEWWLRRKRGLR